LYDHQAEQVVLFNLMDAPGLMAEYKFDISDFHDLSHKHIYNALIKRQKDGEEIRPTAVIDWLNTNGHLNDAGGEEYVRNTLTLVDVDTITSSLKVKDLSSRRKAFEIHQAGAQAALDLSVDLNPAWSISRLKELKDTQDTETAPISTRWTVAELLDTEFPEPRWAIPGLIPEGLTLLGGRPKVGKSWLAMQMAHAIGTGGMFFGQKVERGNVLYIALEDGPRRLQDRIKKHSIPRDAQLTFERAWAPLQEEGMTQLFEEIIKNDYRLVVVDTLTRAFRGLDQNDQPQIDAVMSNIQRMCTDHHLAMIFNDHTTKPKGFMGDPIDDIMNSTVKTAVSDQVLALYKTQGAATATLKGRGRDTVEIDLVLRWDVPTCCWQCEGETGQVAVTQERQEVLEALANLGKSTAPAIAKYLGKDRSNIFRKLNDLHSSQLIRKEDIEGKVYYESM
jgi:hypothetical protein